jgi:hypothetical protein
MIGDEASKEILIEVPQGDVELLKNDASAPLAIRVVGARASTFDATDISLEPRATTQTPHEALSSRLDGPLAVRVNSDPLDPNKPATDELLEPCFKASVALSADQSRRVFAGQLATVEFRTTEQTFARRTATLVSRWLRRAVEQ